MIIRIIIFLIGEEDGLMKRYFFFGMRILVRIRGGEVDVSLIKDGFLGRMVGERKLIR